MDDIDAGSSDFERIAAECPGFQARAMARTLTRYYNAHFKPLDLTSEQFSLLVGVGAKEGSTLAELAASAGIDATTLSRNVRSLAARGLLQIEGGRGRAGKQLCLSVAGRLLMAKALPVWKSAKTELTRQMGDQQLRSAIAAMAELKKAADSTE